MLPVPNICLHTGSDIWVIIKYGPNDPEQDLHINGIA